MLVLFVLAIFAAQKVEGPTVVCRLLVALDGLRSLVLLLEEAEALFGALMQGAAVGLTSSHFKFKLIPLSSA